MSINTFRKKAEYNNPKGNKSHNWKGGLTIDMSKYKKENYLKNRDKQLRRRKEIQNNLRLMILNYYSNNKLVCACCGEKEYKFLSLDHKNGKGNEHRRKIGAKGASGLYYWIVRNNFPDMFQVLCHNCNQAKGYYGQCPHHQ